MMKALKDKGTPGGFALGHATGDANTWCHWLVWTFAASWSTRRTTWSSQPGNAEGARVLEGASNGTSSGHAVVARSEQQQGFPRRQDLGDNNGISIYYGVEESKDPRSTRFRTDINHASYPAGPAGVSSACHLFMNQMTKYTKYPKAAKEFIRFMMEEEQYGAWLQAGIGYTAASRRFTENPIWTVDRSTRLTATPASSCAPQGTRASSATRPRARSPTSSSWTWSRSRLGR